MAFAILGRSDDARACGGCFPPPTETTVVTDHRMAFAISQQQTVLWDQIQYSGDPREFAWVLPVKPGTEVQLSRDAWIGALDATTQPVIQGPAPQPQGGGCGLGCGASATSASFDSNGGGGSVQVVEQKVVGPYETVTLRSTDPKALETWLSSHNFAIADTIKPTIDAYVSEGFDFIALRLQPGEGVRAMQPVRVVTQGADPSLPLRMVAAGVGSQVGLTLYVIGEGRYEAENFPNAKVDDSKLVWFAAQNRSNYQDLVEGLMASNGGRTWVTEFAGNPNLSAASYSYGLAQAYFGACTSGSPPVYTFQDLDAGSDASDAAEDATAEASADDAAPPDAGNPTTCTGGCCDFDDLNVAMKGLHSSTVVVTRLRARLSPDALKAGDLLLIAAQDQSPVSNIHYAPDTSALRSNVGAGVTSRRMGTAVTLCIGLFATIGLLRRRRRSE